MAQTLLLSLLAGLATLGGAFLGLLLPETLPLSVLAGFAGGVMSNVLLSALAPLLGKSSFTVVGLGVGTGVFFVWLAGRKLAGRGARSYWRLGWIMFLAIALHDLPEGIALGAGSALAEQLGFLLALALGLHNLPEGVINAVPLNRSGLSPRKVLALNLLLSLVTPFGTLLGQGIGFSAPSAIPFSLALAGGAMSYVVLKELLPLALSLRGLLSFGVGFWLMEGLSRLVH
ncbi:zinc/iron permease [Ammonifex degensii KC4]|uniref:Zinc/iron permease n=1 Tax=Ammonifex degensii (strain DSM 10501 / KC4) TaxID=429009 RepID=C9RA46_AMMDK|nr:ZIP family metal transporter [Ammonifex degensii]ACX53175.1 zinc/iron permease [Ammonifex degensii KC4]